MQEQSNISSINDGGWERKLDIFTSCLRFNCQRVYCLFFRKENRWLCHSVCINCRYVCCTLSTEMIPIVFVSRERHCYKIRIAVFRKRTVYRSEVIFVRHCVDRLHERFKMLRLLSQWDTLKKKNFFYKLVAHLYWQTTVWYAECVEKTCR